MKILQRVLRLLTGRARSLRLPDREGAGTERRRRIGIAQAQAKDYEALGWR